MNCRSVAHELTELTEGDVPLLRRMGLRFHMAICPACKAYVRQMGETTKALREAAEPRLDERESAAIARRVLERKT